MERSDTAARMTLPITVDQERNFYNSAYAAYLHTPDHALITNRDSLQKELSDPGGLFYERRLLYGAVLRIVFTDSP